MQGVDLQPHIHLRKGQVRPVVVTVGDPKRAETMAKMCDSYKELMFNREFRSFEATHKGQTFTIISHGVGCSGAMVCFEEAIALGAKVILRAGTCGSLQPDKIRTGDVVVPHGVARDTDVTDLYLPLGMPAVPTPRVYQALLQAGKDAGEPVHTGLCLSNSIFYGSGPEHMERLKMWARHVQIVEFEFQALFLVGICRGIETGGIACVDGSPLQWDAGNYDPAGTKCAEGKSRMLRLAIDTCVALSKDFPQ